MLSNTDISSEEMLSDMHDQLSQAVKLYDKLLTEQVAHPRWRSPQPQPVTNSYQQASSNYSTVNGYSQWASPTPATASAYQQQPSSPQASYSEYQNQYAPTQPHATPSQSHWQQQPIQQYAQPNQQQQYIPISAPAPPTFVPPQSPPEPQRRQSQYAEPSQPYQPQATQSPPLIQSLPPVSLNPHQYQPSAPSFIPSSPPAQVQSPPPVQFAASPPPPPQHQQSPIPQSSLSRHKTVSYAAPPPAPPTNAHLARSNTMNHSHVQPRHQIQQQQIQAAPPPAPLPQFPVAPTSAPQTFSLYGPSVPSGFTPPEERKEALLIDL